MLTISRRTAPAATASATWAPIAIAIPVLVTLTLAGPATALALTGGLALMIALVAWAPVRLIAVVLGALLVFQSSANGGKVAYIGLAVACCALSGIRLGRDDNPVIRSFRPLLGGSLALAVMLFISSFVSRASGVPTTDWFRDALPYILLVALPVVGIDAGRDLTRKNADRLIAGIGILAAVGFALDWLDRRGVSGLGVGRVVLASAVLPALAFAYALAHADAGWRAFRWLLVAATIVALLLITGTRTNIVFLIAVLGVVGLKRKAAINPLRLVLYLTGIVAAVVVVVPILGGYVINDPQFLSSRTEAALAAIHGEAASDQSYQAREHSYVLTRQQFKDHRLLGTGPGFAETSDSPWVVPAKFGIVGTVVLMTFFLSIFLSVRKARQASGPLPVYAAARGWALILLALTPFGPWTEDKGMALALTLLTAAVASHANPVSAREAGPPVEPPPGRRIGATVAQWR